MQLVGISGNSESYHPHNKSGSPQMKPEFDKDSYLARQLAEGCVKRWR